MTSAPLLVGIPMSLNDSPGVPEGIFPTLKVKTEFPENSVFSDLTVIWKFVGGDTLGMTLRDVPGVYIV